MKMLRKFAAMLLVAALLAATFAMPAFAAKKVTMEGSTHLRKGAGTKYASKLIIAKGEKATYKKKTKKDSRGVYWLKVKYNGTTGWVSTRFAQLGSNSKKVTATGKAFVRLAPKKSAKKLGVVAKGKKLSYRGKTVKDGRGVKWYHVHFNNQNGWISSRYAKLSK